VRRLYTKDFAMIRSINRADGFSRVTLLVTAFTT
jgi:hypothetical protein